MSAFDALLLGIVQGLTEFLPVSSKGHLVMGQTLLGVRVESLTFEICVHVATLAAVLVVYRRRLLQLAAGHEPQYVAKLALACLPVGAAGLLLKERVEAVFHDPAITGAGLLFTGAVLFATRFRPGGEADAPTWRGALLIGLAQCLALLPGVSRSGVTIAAALALGVGGSAAAEFSFLLSVPVILAAAGLEAATVALGGDVPAPALAVGFVASFVSGIVALVLVYRILLKRHFSDFAFYCWAAGLLFLGYLAWR